MALLATPDFGASVAAGLFLLIVWVIVLVLAAIGIARGWRLLKGDSAKGRKYGVVLVFVSGLVPLSCCVGPPQVIRLVYGNYPIGSYPNNQIQPGMSFADVEATLGKPLERHKQGDEVRWYYWIDSFGITWFGVDFGPDGRVRHTYGN